MLAAVANDLLTGWEFSSRLWHKLDQVKQGLFTINKPKYFLCHLSCLNSGSGYLLITHLFNVDLTGKF